MGDWFQGQNVHLATGHVAVKLARGSESVGVQIVAGLSAAWHAAVTLLAHPMVRSCLSSQPTFV